MVNNNKGNMTLYNMILICDIFAGYVKSCPFGHSAGLRTISHGIYWRRTYNSLPVSLCKACHNYWPFDAVVNKLGGSLDLGAKIVVEESTSYDYKVTNLVPVFRPQSMRVRRQMPGRTCSGYDGVITLSGVISLSSIIYSIGQCVISLSFNRSNNHAAYYSVNVVNMQLYT